MSTGNVSISPALRQAAAVVLALSIVSIGGCDTSTPPPQQSRTAIDMQEAQPANARIRMDPARNRMWVLTHDGVFLYDTATPKLIAEIALPGWQEVDARYSCPADLAVGPRGEALVTSNVVPTLWRIDPETLAVSVHELALDADREKDVGFSRLTYSVEHGVFFAVSAAHGTLWRIDPLLRRAERVQRSESIRKACGVAVPMTQVVREMD